MEYYSSEDKSDLININNKVISIENNLHIIGFGGSIPAYREGKMQFPGYPYNTDEELNNDLIKLEEYMNLEGEYIFCSHCGPDKSLTSLGYGKDENLKFSSGSESVLKFIKKNEKVLI